MRNFSLRSFKETIKAAACRECSGDVTPFTRYLADNRRVMRRALIIFTAIVGAALLMTSGWRSKPAVERQMEPGTFRIGVTVWKKPRRTHCPVLIANVTPGSPAADAGLRPGDAIMTVDGYKPITLVDATARLVSDQPTSVRLGIMRDNDAFEVTVLRRELVESNGNQNRSDLSTRKKLRNGELIPEWFPAKYVDCFPSPIQPQQPPPSTHPPGR